MSGKVEPYTPWIVDDKGELTIDTIRSIHQPNDNYRISRYEYQRDTRFACASRLGLVYVLSGSCRYEKQGRVWQLTAPCYTELPSGQFDFSVESSESVELVCVWELPDGFLESDRRNEPGDRPESPTEPTANG